ncbi:putative protein RMD5-like protein A [Iris pallida]|uniref:Uncharacterized protein n=1 Tax=Iris pallida TaxID=29817 RepID=A0AAX6EX56_IRIPA|nr:putative protein RMD5-like protein A [Iris pallida]
MATGHQHRRVLFVPLFPQHWTDKARVELKLASKIQRHGQLIHFLPLLLLSSHHHTRHLQ